MIFSFRRKNILENIIYIPRVSTYYFYTISTKEECRMQHKEFFEYYDDAICVQKLENFNDKIYYSVQSLPDNLLDRMSNGIHQININLFLII